MRRGTARLAAALVASASPLAAEAAPDWLVDPSPYRASVQVAADGRSLSVSNGLLRRTIRLSPNAATVALDNLMTGASEIRSVRPEAVVEIDGRRFDVGGLVGQKVHNYLLPEWVEGLRADPAAFRLVRHETGTTRERFPWKKHPEWLSRDLPWPPPGVSLTLEFQPPEGAGFEAAVLVHYELYDGIPLVAKWIEVRNRGQAPLRLNRFVGEILATVETNSFVGVRDPAEFTADPRSIHVETDFSFGDGMTARVAAAGVHWKPDPLYPTQVNYARQTPCLVETHPEIGPDQVIEPGATFESFRTFVLLHDSTDRERRGLALRRMYRTLAPWSQENPVLMHVRSADPAAVRLAVDQAADVGFELVILTFGSGFEIENEDPAYLGGIRGLVEYARSKGVALGGYSLLASRKVSEADDVVNPKTGRPGGFATFGDSPCLGSRWGQDYFRKLRQFFEKTGAEVLEHDGSYPGDACASTAHPGHRGLRRLAVGPVDDDPRLLPLVPGARRLPERARLVLPLRLQQDGHGLPRDQLVPAARAAGDRRAAERLRRHLGEDTEHGLDVRAAHASTTVAAPPRRSSPSPSTSRTTRRGSPTSSGPGSRPATAGRGSTTPRRRGPSSGSGWASTRPTGRSWTATSSTSAGRTGATGTGSSTSTRASRRAAWP